MGRIVIDETRCKGCGLCTLACARKLLSISEKMNVHGYTVASITDMELCTGCALCAEICPDVAIIVYRDK
jgi:2-oxoglutarate ferredoxin oxidoreductase subunit delta